MTSGHPTREEDFDLYALGALEGDERQAIASHVAACPACAQKLAVARGRVALIGMATPEVAVPPNVRQRLIARIRLESTAGPATVPARREPAPRTESARWWSIVLAPAGAALVIATIMLWSQNEKLKTQLDQLRSSVASQQQQLEESEHAADLLAARDTVVVPLAPMPGAPQGTARVAFNKNMGMLMYDGSIAPAPEHMSYQLWLMPTEGAPINAGVFNPKPGETDHWMMQLPPGVTPKAFAITLEPAGGMPHPTGPKLLAASVS